MANEKETNKKPAEKQGKEKKTVNTALAIGIVVAEAVLVLIIALIVRGA